MLIDSVETDPALPEDSSTTWTAVLEYVHNLQASGQSVAWESFGDSLKEIRSNLQPDYSPKTNKLIALVDNPEVLPAPELMELWNDSLRANTARALKDFELKRTGIKWEVAGGLIWDFPNQVANNGKLRGGGVWTTLSAPNIPYQGAEALFTARYIHNELFAIDENVFDFGVRILYELDKYLVSYEYVRRIPDFDFERDDEQWRQALVLEIELAPGKRVSLTVGEDFDRETADSFLAQLGLNIGIRNLGLAN